MSLTTGAVAAAVTVAAAATILFSEERVERLGAPAEEWIASVEGETAELWAVGDADPPKSGRVAQLVRKDDPDLILYLGDVYPTGTRNDFRRWAKPWGDLVDRMAPTPGNHEWPNARTGYEPFWKQRTGEKPPAYYALDAGGWQILSVNSESANQAPAKNWLRYMTRSGGNCRIAFWHRPRYSAGHHPGSTAARGLWEALDGHARLIVNGHDHNMQRFRARGGVVELVSGAGGRKLYPVKERYRGLVFSDDRHYGGLHLSLSPGEARWRFVSARGRVLDKGTLRCSDA